jgi:hypothetical protein
MSFELVREGKGSCEDPLTIQMAEVQRFGTRKIETLAPFRSFRVVPRRNLTRYFFARPMEVLSAQFWRFFLVQYALVLRRASCSKLALQAWQVILSLKIMLTGEGLDSWDKSLLSGCLREALQDEHLFLAEEATDASDLMSIFTTKFIV